MALLRIATIIIYISISSAACGHTLTAIEANTCAVASNLDGKQPLQTPALVQQGNAYLDGALRVLPDPANYDVEGALRQSTICLGHALRLDPDSYEAQLGMGVVDLARARLRPHGSAEHANLLNGARSLLGGAYMLRHGTYEPLYYLAEVAVEEGNLAVARKLLEPLRLAGAKEGPVNVLLGHLSEVEGKPEEAAMFYRKALMAGWPAESLSFASARLRAL
jgi:tetratricopeptide (TPR) repeat protein